MEAASSRVRICVKQLARASVVLTPPPQDNKNVEVDYQPAWRPEWSFIHAECGPFRFVNWGYAGAGEPVGWVSAVDVVEWVAWWLLLPVRYVLDSGGWVYLYCNLGVYGFATPTCIVMQEFFPRGVGLRGGWLLEWRGRASGIDEHEEIMKFCMSASRS